jgi:anti-sigma regulatory factor (Ser/Thr protein kinase)
MTGSSWPFEAMRCVLELRGAASEFPRLAKFAEEFACLCGLADCERSRLLIMLEELFTNAVHYGYRDGAGHGRIEIALAAKPGRLEIEFCDDGIPFDPLARELPDIGPPGGDSGIGGQGLRIVRSLAHEAHYRREHGRNRLALVRRLSVCDR